MGLGQDDPMQTPRDPIWLNGMQQPLWSSINDRWIMIKVVRCPRISVHEASQVKCNSWPEAKGEIRLGNFECFTIKSCLHRAYKI